MNTGKKYPDMWDFLAALFPPGRVGYLKKTVGNILYFSYCKHIPIKKPNPVMNDPTNKPGIVYSSVLYGFIVVTVVLGDIFLHHHEHGHCSLFYFY